ncbi:MAG: membrane protein insertase YidC [Clostridia bacterium]|nr:membrane protein insertase YidC [Clostridia bacterium]
MSFIYVPFSYVMKFCVWISQNSYFFGLFFFALAFEIILLPLAIKQKKSQIAMARVRPKEYAIRKKYAGRTDRVTQQKMQMELNEMHQQEGVNPLSGCLPLLIMLPVILILFAIVRQPVTYSSDFTDGAREAIRNEVVELHPDYNKDEEFNTVISQFAFDYLDDIRANLVKDHDSAKEANTILLEEQVKLGAAVQYKDPDADNKEIIKLENGFDKYAIDGKSNSTYRETAVASVFANFGEDYVATLKEAGALPANYENPIPLYIVEEGEKVYYTDMMPNFTLLGVNLLNQPSFSENETWQDWALLLIPILVFLTSFLGHKVTMRNQPSQTKPDGTPMQPGLFMTVGMPLLSTFFTLAMPAAIGCYWIWRTLLNMVKEPILSKVYPMPRFTQEELEEAARELNAKAKGKKKKVITIEVDEDDDSYADIEVKGASASAHVDAARPKPSGKKAELPYRRPTSIEMLSAEDDEPTKE